MTKAIYYSKKMKKYYFSNITIFGDYFAETVYGCENLEPTSIEIKTDKNGKQYFLAEVVQVKGQNGKKYYKCLGPAPKKEKAETAEAVVADVVNGI